MLVYLGKHSHVVSVIAQKGDHNYYATDWSTAESTMLYHVKQELIKKGYDCIKKRMWKDGHMVDDTQQYIRDRKGKWCIYNQDYAIYDAGEKLNEDGCIELRYEEL